MKITCFDAIMKLQKYRKKIVLDNILQQELEENVFSSEITFELFSLGFLTAVRVDYAN